jgi:hypothetical protein
MPDFVCVLREPEYSPGKVEDDAAILLAVAALLRRERYAVDVLDPRNRRWPRLQPRTVVLTMAQGEHALERLLEWESRGIRVMNSVEAVRNCHRQRTVQLMEAAGLAWPTTMVVSTAARKLPSWLDCEGGWVKRGDVHAMQEGDVRFVRGSEDALRVLRNLRARGIRTAVLQQHAAGRVVKFYGVAERFFFVAHPGPLPVGEQRALAALARRAARVSGLEMFGGDCVIGASGSCQLIDLNDWPSYAACRQRAAEAIAAHARAEKAKVA